MATSNQRNTNKMPWRTRSSPVRTHCLFKQWRPWIKEIVMSSKWQRVDVVRSSFTVLQENKKWKWKVEKPGASTKETGVISAPAGKAVPNQVNRFEFEFFFQKYSAITLQHIFCKVKSEEKFSFLSLGDSSALRVTTRFIPYFRDILTILFCSTAFGAWHMAKSTL